ncbi:MAG: ammonium transporter [Hoeflea sp.]|nr:ammonium transporter [Alphaproteobacteria bacterium]MBV1725111.1 ammonium transporter [Hoeflea sp.]MBU4544691.1 ammonium transporter [Alphaproteobacteria bacterium]MBU4552922.1 ammonium transporter [Alphaproteobacteria bacterium]MBV1761131.1 ammonium transporter [Hoeflea sp.]
MSHTSPLRLGLIAAGALTTFTLPGFAQDAAAPAVATIDKGDTTFMLVSTILVLLMILPGLALFYGGLVRTKNMLSVLIQCTLITALVMVIWVLYGYSFAFGGSESAFWGGTAKMFLAGVTPASEAATFSDGVMIPEYIFIAFQMTFACITPALIVGAFAERVRFSAVMLFVALWVTFVYFPVAHMVWDANGLLFKMGALDFAGGTVVHINAGIAGLIGAIMIGKRTGFGRDMMAPHSMTLTMVGACLLWFGWFGFNAGSNLEANGGAALAMINTFTATAGAILAWTAIETLHRGKASLLGAVSGMIAGLVAVTPAAGFAGPVGAIALGAVASGLCYYFVAVVKNKFGYDDTADVFGIHGIGGIVGALGTAVVNMPGLGGAGGEDYAVGSQLMIQASAVGITILWCGILSIVLYKIVDMTIGLRASVEDERQGLDLASHGEAAYHG